MTAMSTPIQQIPPQAPAAGSAGAEEDPVVRDVLREMDAEIATATRAVAPQPPPQAGPRIPVPAPGYAMRLPPGFRPGPPPAPWTGPHQLYNPIAMQRAAIAAIIAGLIFYPATLEFVFEKIPALSPLASYETIVRVALLALVLYLVMWKLHM